jgi:hypothetical protein
MPKMQTKKQKKSEGPWEENWDAHWIAEKDPRHKKYVSEHNKRLRRLQREADGSNMESPEQ